MLATNKSECDRGEDVASRLVDAIVAFLSLQQYIYRVGEPHNCLCGILHQVHALFRFFVPAHNPNVLSPSCSCVNHITQVAVAQEPKIRKHTHIFRIVKVGRNRVNKRYHDSIPTLNHKVCNLVVTYEEPIHDATRDTRDLVAQLTVLV